MVDIPIKSLYLHYPFCKNLCNYCDFYKGLPTQELENSYDQLLIKMFKEHDQLLKDQGYVFDQLETIYIGGGTPSLWGTRGAKLLENEFNSRGISLTDNCEFTLEVNPGDWTTESLRAWRDLGVNRYSVGIQSLNSTFLKILDRTHSIDEVFNTLDYFSREKENYSVDFILGLPYSSQYKRNVLEELDEILRYSPSHISLYILTVKDNYKHFAELPDDEYIEREYLEVADFLKSKGFEHYEVSNFSKPNKESIHNKKYWKMDSVAAIGPSATGYLADSRFRYKWKTKDVKLEIEKLNDKEFLIEDLYMNLRIRDGLSLNYFNDQEFYQIGKKWVEHNWAEIIDGRICLTSKGFLVLDTLMDNLFIQYKEKF